MLGFDIIDGANLNKFLYHCSSQSVYYWIGANKSGNNKNINTYPNCSEGIYKRYGEKVYSSVGYGLSWDGRRGGVKSPFSTYYYMIDLRNGVKILSGSITIIR